MTRKTSQKGGVIGIPNRTSILPKHQLHKIGTTYRKTEGLAEILNKNNQNHSPKMKNTIEEDETISEPLLEKIGTFFLMQLFKSEILDSSPVDDMINYYQNNKINSNNNKTEKEQLELDYTFYIFFTKKVWMISVLKYIHKMMSHKNPKPPSDNDTSLPDEQKGGIGWGIGLDIMVILFIMVYMTKINIENTNIMSVCRNKDYKNIEKANYENEILSEGNLRRTLIDQRTSKILQFVKTNKESNHHDVSIMTKQDTAKILLETQQIDLTYSYYYKPYGMTDANWETMNTLINEEMTSYSSDLYKDITKQLTGQHLRGGEDVDKLYFEILKFLKEKTCVNDENIMICSHYPETIVQTYVQDYLDVFLNEAYNKKKKSEIAALNDPNFTKFGKGVVDTTLIVGTAAVARAGVFAMGNYTLLQKFENTTRAVINNPQSVVNAIAAAKIFESTLRIKKNMYDEEMAQAAYAAATYVKEGKKMRELNKVWDFRNKIHVEIDPDVKAQIEHMKQPTYSNELRKRMREDVVFQLLTLLLDATNFAVKLPRNMLELRHRIKQNIYHNNIQTFSDIFSDKYDPVIAYVNTKPGKDFFEKNAHFDAFDFLLIYFFVRSMYGMRHAIVICIGLMTKKITIFEALNILIGGHPMLPMQRIADEPVPPPPPNVPEMPIIPPREGPRKRKLNPNALNDEKQLIVGGFCLSNQKKSHKYRKYNRNKFTKKYNRL